MKSSYENQSTVCEFKKKKKTNQGEESNKNLKEPLVFQWD